MSKDNNDGIPIIMPYQNPKFDINKPIAKCGICGFVVRPNESFGYVCGNNDCPIFPNVTCT